MSLKYLRSRQTNKETYIFQTPSARTWENIFRDNKAVNSSRYAPSHKKSILNEDHQSKEANDYLQLLQKFEPSLYNTSGVKNTETKTTSFLHRNSLSRASNVSNDSRKIPLLHSRNFSDSVVTLEDSDGEEVTEIIELDEDDEKMVSVFDKYKSEFIITPSVSKERIL